MYFSIGMLFYALGMVAWNYYEVILKVTPPYPGLPDFFWLCNYVFFLLGIFKSFKHKRKLLKTLRFMFDLLITLGVAATLTWSYIAKPLLASLHNESLLTKIVYLSYPLLDFCILLSVLGFYYAPKVFTRKVSTLLLLGLFFLSFSDTFYVYWVVLDQYHTGTLVDPLWSLSFLLIGLSSLYYENESDIPFSKRGGAIRNYQNDEMLRIFFPYVNVIILLILALADYEKIPKMGLIVVVLLVIIRQITIILENTRLLHDLSVLNSSLEKTIDLRTQELDESQERFNSLFTYHPNAVFSMNLEGRFTNVNIACLQLFGLTRENLIGSQVEILFKENDYVLRNFFNYAIEGSSQKFEIPFIKRDMSEISLEITYIPILVRTNIMGVYGVAKDITLQKKNQEEIHHLAYHDALTELPNRRLFEDRLDQGILQAKRTHQKIAVLFIDLDGFKIINDTLGHQFGDEVLLLVANRLTSCLRVSDTVARLGGDEFTVLLTGISSTEDALRTVEKILNALKDPFRISGRVFNVSGSIGIALYPEGGHDALSLMKNADTAMYSIKAKGKNNYELFTPESVN
jgi:diguanylate cyclase (GGDEF)-like protein/PAS domain S-box-containing protein